MLTLTHLAGKQLEYRLEGQLTGEDYRQGIAPVRQALNDQTQLNLLVEIIDFTGWDASAIWQEARFDLKLRDQIDKVALVGDARFEAWGGRFGRELMPVQVQFFSNLQAARDWLSS